jgi:hypothetical protein
MALSRAQQEFIEGSISHLLEFPVNPDTLREAVKNLKSVLKKPLDSDNEFHFLYKCLMRPQEFLQRLETYNDKNANVTIGDVQRYIIDLTTKAIDTAAAKTGKSSRDFSWRPEKIKKRVISSKNDKTVFRTITPRPETYQHPWQNIYCENSIYTGKLIRLNGEEFIRLDILVRLPDETRKVTILDFKPIPDTYYFEDDLMMRHIPAAMNAACEQAGEFVYRYLASAGRAAESVIDLAEKNRHLKWLVTDQVYLDLLANGTITLEKIATLNENQIEKLLLPISRSLLREQICPLHVIIDLNEYELRVLTSYFSLLRTRLNFSDVIGIDAQQLKVLCHPVIVNLINRDRLLFSDAKKLPAHICLLLTSDLYQDYISSEPIDWIRLQYINPDACEFLLDKDIANLIKHQCFKLTDIIFLDVETRRNLLKPNIQSLILHKNMTLNDLTLISDKSVEMICGDPYICQGILQGDLSIADVNPAHLPSIYTKMLAKRLSDIFDGRPSRMTGYPDSFEHIMRDIALMAIHANMEPETMRECVIRRFIWNIQIKLQDLLSCGLSAVENLWLNKLLDIIRPLHDSNMEWETIFQNLMAASKSLAHESSQMVSSLPAKPGSGLTFFSGRPTAQPGKLGAFCKKLAEYSVLLPVAAVKSSASMKGL